MGPSSSRRGLRILLTNIGTFGDIHPLIALALELKQRGHQPVIAAPAIYSYKVQPLGIAFHAIRPDIDPDDTALVEKVFHPRRGTEYGVRRIILPALRQTYDDLYAAATADGGADILLIGEITYAGVLVAEKTGIPWASYVLAPFSLFSAFDPPALPLPGAAALTRHRSLRHLFGHTLNLAARVASHSWPRPIYQLRQQLGLPHGRNPIFDAKHSPRLALAMFSRVLGTPQLDWPSSVLQTGFVFYDGNIAHSPISGQPAPEVTSTLPPALQAFLAAGPPPIVFTLGSAAVLTAGAFFEQSAAAAKLLNQRAILLLGPDPRNRPTAPLPPSILCWEYAAYSQLFPYASAVVHQGGVGTTAQALRAATPALIIPFSHDQPDNAERVRRLGAGETLTRTHYSAAQAARLLHRLTSQSSYRAAALSAAQVIASEPGIARACDALLSLAQT